MLPKTREILYAISLKAGSRQINQVRFDVGGFFGTRPVSGCVCDDWYYYTTRGGVPVEDLATPPAFAELLLAMARSARRSPR